jgi:outer membrane cobalamin receptor
MAKTPVVGQSSRSIASRARTIAGILCRTRMSIPSVLKVLVLASLLTPTAAAQEPASPQTRPAVQPPDEPSLDDVVVVTASRREEQLVNAPATMTVITEETIATAPALSITDMLRRVPGLNIVVTSARDVNVTSRGATGTLSDSTLVLLDGRSIYQDFFGSVLWDFVPIDMSEIKRIEVIRGPASAVWGANAMTGVINVITKTPREMPGTTVAVRFGQFDRWPTDPSRGAGCSR